MANFALSSYLPRVVIDIVADYLAENSHSISDLNAMRSLVDKDCAAHLDIPGKIAQATAPFFLQCTNSKKRKSSACNHKYLQIQIGRVIRNYDADSRLTTLSKLLSTPSAITSQDCLRKDFWRATLLMKLVEKGFTSTITRVLPGLTEDQQEKLVNEQDIQGSTALMRAATLDTERHSCIQILFQMRADANIRNQAGKTALMFALDAQCHDPESLQALIQKSPPLDASDTQGETAYTIATKVNNTAALALLQPATALQ